VKEPNKTLFVDWTPYLGQNLRQDCDTRVDVKLLKQLANQLCEIPEGFVLQRQVEKIVEDRRKMTAGALPINWGYAETLAYATLVQQGHPERRLRHYPNRTALQPKHRPTGFSERLFFA